MPPRLDNTLRAAPVNGCGWRSKQLWGSAGGILRSLGSTGGVEPRPVCAGKRHAKTKSYLATPAITGWHDALGRSGAASYIHDTRWHWSTTLDEQTRFYARRYGHELT